MPPVLLPYLLPAFIVFIIAELAYSWVEKKELYTAKDTASNICVGLFMFISNLLMKYLVFWMLTWLYQFRLFNTNSSWITWVAAFLACDFTFYWYHRACHEINWFWSSHVVHHSSEKMNITVAFRQSLTGSLSGHFLFWCWMPLLGFSPFIIIIARESVLFYQFFLHTETITKFPSWVERIFNTPSHHRVHHSSNPDYLDKNHGGILIIWDRLFGTFCEEQAKPRYGLTSPFYTYNPFKINFHSWQELFRSAKNAPDFYTGIKYVFMPPGWSHDGSTQTVKQQRRAHRRKKKARIAGMNRMEPGSGQRLAGAA